MDKILEPFKKYAKHDDEVFDHLNYPGVTKYKYVISNYGRLFSFAKEKELKYFLDKDGYKRVGIIRYIDGERHKSPVPVHRMVAMTFIDKLYDHTNIVNHKDGNKQNNYYSNLEWTTVAGNTQHAIFTGLRNQHKFVTYDEETVRKICIYLESGLDFKEIYSAFRGEGPIMDRAFYMLIYRIQKGTAHIDITSEYDIFGGYISRNRPRFTKEEVDKILAYIHCGLTNKEIMTKFGMKSKRESQKSRRLYDKILSLRRLADMSSSTRES